MSGKVVGHAAHDCVRDSLPGWPSGRYKYREGDYVRCECGQVWLVIDEVFCHYRRVSRRRLRKLVKAGMIQEGGEE